MLQIVFMIRTSKFVGNCNWILIISTIQSIISMASSMINGDNAYMSTIEFKRLCEITYRIGLLSLFWVVVSGEAIFVLLIIEVSLISGFLLTEFTKQRRSKNGSTFTGITFDSNTAFLALNQLVVLTMRLILLGVV